MIFIGSKQRATISVLILAMGAMSSAPRERLQESSLETVALVEAAEEAVIRSHVRKPWQDNVVTERETAMTYIGSYYVTGYDICVQCCGKVDGITKSGTTAMVGQTVAAPEDMPYGKKLFIDGIGERIVEDRGEGVTGKCLDVLCEDHDACFAITGWHDVYIVEDAK